MSALDCGHPLSLEIKSVESDYRFCDLCEERSRRRDAEKRERELRAEVDRLRAALRAADGSHLHADGCTWAGEQFMPEREETHCRDCNCDLVRYRLVRAALEAAP